MSRLVLGLLIALPAGRAMAWGEWGHHLVGRTAARLIVHHPALAPLRAGTPAERRAAAALVEVFDGKWIQQGHLGNIPDNHWKNLEGGLSEDGRLLGDAAHFLDMEYLADEKALAAGTALPLPLGFDAAKAVAAQRRPDTVFFRQGGTLPWRTAQLTELYRGSLSRQPPPPCAKADSDNPPMREALAYAGILSHFVADATQPYHVTEDYDGVGTRQKGIHAYFEITILNELGENLGAQVAARARELVEAPASRRGSVAWFRAEVARHYGSLQPESETIALMLVLAQDSYLRIPDVAALDRRYAIDPPVPDNPCGDGQKTMPCRRPPRTRVKGKTVARHFEPLVVERLALAAALTTDLWVRGWLATQRPELCWAWTYALKPSFVSPTDKTCLGYALQEGPETLLRKDGTSALPWKQPAPSPDRCLGF